MRRIRIQRRRALAIALLPVAALTTNSMFASAAEQREAQIKPAQKSVRVGKGITLRGRFPGAPNARVKILYRGAGQQGFRQVASARTGDDERWKKRVKPRRTGKWRARLAPATDADGRETLLAPAEPSTADRETGSKRVRVRSVTRVRTTKRHARIGDKVKVRGRVAPAGKRRVIVRAGGKKLPTRTNRNGRFSVRWKAGSTGTHRVTAKARSNRIASGSRDRGGRVIVYRPAAASWYGPGFYGNRTACGQTLSSGMLGVAHKTMPCGTKLKLRNDGKTVTVRVIDRGPYAHGREFDLTEATKRKLGFGSTGTILSSK